MAKPVKLTAGSLPLKACLGSGGQHCGSLPCRMTTMPTQRSRASRPGVNRDELYHVAEASGIHTSLEGFLNDTRSLLELHKASKVSISEDESILDTIGSWSGCLLKEHLRSGALQRTPLCREVEHALECPFYTTLDRLDHRRNIENFDVTGHHMLKSSYLSCYNNNEILALGVRDFSASQFTYQEELRHLDSWVKESRLDQLPFARQKLAYFYLSAAGTIFTPELSDARILWAKNGVLTTIVDDFFDVGGSKEELENLVTLVEMWDEHHKIEFYSEHVEIVFSAIYTSVNELGAKASLLQDRDVTKHLVEIWLDLLRSMMTEVEWRMTKYVPTAEEYITNAVLTFALGPIVLPALYFVGPKIPESVVEDPEYNELFRLMSTCGRLLNDVQTYEREYNEGKVNSVSLLVLQSRGSMSIAEARREMQKPIDTCRRDLLGLVLRKEGAVPTPCKELFWKMCKVCYYFYSQGDAFSSPEEKAREVDAVINLPLQLKGSNASMPVLWATASMMCRDTKFHNCEASSQPMAATTNKSYKLVEDCTSKESVVPRPCQELFRKMCKVRYYSQTDGFSSPVKAIEVDVFSEPLQLNPGKSSRSLSLSGGVTESRCDHSMCSRNT
ncbi:Acyclic sesquiterpene synthase [Dichanthelium oligosanthes]|uniref:Acyclic sesquiterpene synthase n=1 Tax=Dichanthelium oligosanthes TaxID=888268 RepID=A0A1E5WGY8_9POAL|nr:Acyclic sesquiterpene synthase [Dichanthelium oligosanthes]